MTAAAVEYCCCSSCRAFYRRRPFDGWQLRLFPRAAFGEPATFSSGSAPCSDAPLPDPKPATPDAGGMTPPATEPAHA